MSSAVVRDNAWVNRVISHQGLGWQMLCQAALTTLVPMLV